MQGMETGGEESPENIGIRGVNAAGIIRGSLCEEGRRGARGGVREQGWKRVVGVYEECYVDYQGIWTWDCEYKGQRGRIRVA